MNEYKNKDLVGCYKYSMGSIFFKKKTNCSLHDHFSIIAVLSKKYPTIIRKPNENLKF